MEIITSSRLLTQAIAIIILLMCTLCTAFFGLRFAFTPTTLNGQLCEEIPALATISNCPLGKTIDLLEIAYPLVTTNRADVSPTLDNYQRERVDLQTGGTIYFYEVDASIWGSTIISLTYDESDRLVRINDEN